MLLLRDYAITPDVFDLTSYSNNEEICGLHLNAIREVMMTEGLVRDLRTGEWRALFANDGRPWHRRGRELVKKLAAQGRLVDLPAVLPTAPADDRGWCAEALATHGIRALTGGVIVTKAVKEVYVTEPLVASIDQLPATAWWAARSPSARLPRTLAAYLQHLDPILRCANSIQFIDPHVDPGKYRYREFGQLLVAAGRRTPAPLIEIHRVCYEGSGRGRQLLDLAELEQAFRDVLSAPLRSAGLEAEVFVWDDFHDRSLVSNLMGISMSNGFDTTTSQNDITTWNRLGRTDRDDVQREFDPASRHHSLQRRFLVR
jgi:hypothetical protein